MVRRPSQSRRTGAPYLAAHLHPGRSAAGVDYSRRRRSNRELSAGGAAARSAQQGGSAKPVAHHTGRPPRKLFARRANQDLSGVPRVFEEEQSTGGRLISVISPSTTLRRSQILVDERNHANAIAVFRFREAGCGGPVFEHDHILNPVTGSQVRPPRRSISRRSRLAGLPSVDVSKRGMALRSAAAFRRSSRLA